MSLAELVYVDKEINIHPRSYTTTIIAYSWSKSLSIPGEMNLDALALYLQSLITLRRFMAAATVANFAISGDTNALQLFS